MLHSSLWIFSGILATCVLTAVHGWGLGPNHKKTEVRPGLREKQSVSLQDLWTQYDLPALAIGLGTSEGFESQVIGVRKEGNTIPVRKTDIFHIGSNTKSMTATLIALLVQNGSISWTTPMSKVFPNLEVSQANSDITIEQLTSHRSGIIHDYHLDSIFWISLYNMSAHDGRLVVTKRALAEPTNTGKGKFFYSNTNYVILGLVIDRITGGLAEDLFHTHLFTPLGIQSAGFGPCPESSETSIENPWLHLASPLGPVPVPFPQKYRDNPPVLSTAGRVHIGLDDYNRYLQVHLGGAVTTKSIIGISPASFHKLHEQYPETNKSNPGYGYTYGGWFRINYTDGSTDYLLQHDGSNTVNYASALLDTRQNAAFFSMTNVGGEGAMNATETAVSEMFFGDLVPS